MNQILTVLNYLGYAATVIVVITTIIAIVAWFKGILPALVRLGNGLATRKIAIFAKSDTLSSLSSLLTDSGLISSKNIVHIAKEDDFGKAEGSTLFLVYWPDWKDKLMEIKNKKLDGEALVVYAPRSSGMIPENIMAELDKGRNVAVVNFRGRLLNDIVTAMITTGYTKK
ncbi:MAG TPA: hypothetical protein ACFYEK_18220 [Candidatus Wunengus sp. YC60]|uniref:hypothetical protein n=1 Tax=Candidatus Wunengus sp. YC60 TaxID=3367697 RepID=UPI004026FB3D